MPAVSEAAEEFDKGEVISMDYTMTPREIPPTITAYGWDYVAKEMVQGSLAAGDMDPIGGGGVVSGNEVWSTESYLSDLWVDSQESATALAEAEMNRLGRGFLRGRATVQGNGALHVGRLVKFTGHPDKFNPTGFVLSARHRVYVGGGFTTELVFCSNSYPE